ncbi:MAG: DUF397 domain-containing protein [Kutzneria sp.]|nr:DUF397 domain-containing protein [Kutzneria sp.]
MIEVSYPMPPNAPNHNGWFKSSFSSNANNCVEVRFDGDRVGVRDSKYRRNPANHPGREPIITVTAAQWMVWLDELTGHADMGTNGVLSVETTPDGGAILRGAGTTVTLCYTSAEWQTYLAGVREGEFDHPNLAALAS